MHTPYKIHTLAFLIAAVFSQAAQAQTAEDPPAESAGSARLENIHVKGQRNTRGGTVEQVDRETIAREMIRDTRDLVRYNADVGISDDGRRLKGFAMRGVEDNRVGISIDGIALPASEENSLYARYGNFNNSRLSIDPELVRAIDITKGSDSFHSGSGALGGNVNYRTLNAADLIQGDKAFGGLLRSGYAGKNREWVNTAGVGYLGEQLDAVLVYSHRYGHELKSAGGKVAPAQLGRYDGPNDTARNAEVGDARKDPDPSRHRQNSFLAKISYQFSPEHKAGVAVNNQNLHNYVYEHSYGLTSSWREADDFQKRLNANVFYEYTPESNWLSMLKTDFDYQRTENGAINYKGTYDRVGGNWRDGYLYAKGALQNRDNRNMKTHFYRLNLGLESQPLSFWGGSHTLRLNAFASKRHFRNINTDDILRPDGSVSYSQTYTIQRPVNTTQLGLSLSDSTVWNDTFSTLAGIRYDYEKVTPKDFESGVPCTKPCQRAGDLPAKSFRTVNGVLGFDVRLNPTWKIGYNISTGHRIPTASEMYFTYDNPYGKWLANPKLKAERSVNHNLSFSGAGRYGKLELNLYQSRYRNFLFETESVGYTFVPECTDTYNGILCHQWTPGSFNQMVNIDKARVNGLEFKGAWDFAKGWRLSGTLGYSKAKLSSGDSLLSIQPMKAVLGLDYEDPGERWGIYTRLSYFGTKKPKDALHTERWAECTRRNYWDLCMEWTERERQQSVRWLNNKAFVFDVFGHYRPIKNLTVRAGIYNVFNRKYHTWDALRGINTHSTINSLSTRNPVAAQQGLERYYAPGRNFAVSLEYKF